MDSRYAVYVIRPKEETALTKFVFDETMKYLEASKVNVIFDKSSAFKIDFTIIINEEAVMDGEKMTYDGTCDIDTSKQRVFAVWDIEDGLFLSPLVRSNKENVYKLWGSIELPRLCYCHTQEYTVVSRASIGNAEKLTSLSSSVASTPVKANTLPFHLNLLTPI